MVKKIVISILLVLSLQTTSYAFDHISGYAALRLVAKKQIIECDQAIVIEPGKAVFSALDDMGAEMFRVVFDDAGMTFMRDGAVLKSGPGQLKKFLSLPVSQAEFLKIISHDKPDGFAVVPDSSPQKWQRIKGKPLDVTYKGFITLNGKKFPNHVHIGNGKNSLSLRWIDVVAKKVKKSEGRKVEGQKEKRS